MRYAISYHKTGFVRTRIFCTHSGFYLVLYQIKNPLNSPLRRLGVDPSVNRSSFLFDSLYFSYFLPLNCASPPPPPQTGKRSFHQLGPKPAHYFRGVRSSGQWGQGLREHEQRQRFLADGSLLQRVAILHSAVLEQSCCWFWPGSPLQRENCH